MTFGKVTAEARVEVAVTADADVSDVSIEVADTVAAVVFKNALEESGVSVPLLSPHAVIKATITSKTMGRSLFIQALPSDLQSIAISLFIFAIRSSAVSICLSE